MSEIDLEADLNNLAMSEEARPLLDAVKKHIADNVEPITEEFYRLGEGRADRWSWAPGQLELLEEAKNKAKASGLWNFFLPDAETGEGLKNLDYAYIAAELGKNPLASETLNCSAPDTGNMEVLERVGTEEQKEKWLKPLRQISGLEPYRGMLEGEKPNHSESEGGRREAKIGGLAAPQPRVLTEPNLCGPFQR